MNTSAVTAEALTEIGGEPSGPALEQRLALWAGRYRVSEMRSPRAAAYPNAAVAK
jgi:hypothetical protein